VKLSVVYPAVAQRRLIPVFRLDSVPIAWECAACGKMFVLPLQEAYAQWFRLPPPHIDREFRIHNCELHLRESYVAPDL
jgi:hypothetical protein